jgi:hypothetical protein
MNEKQKLKTEALKEVNKELSEYRKLVMSKSSQQIYLSATEIMLTEACASYIGILLNCDIIDFSSKVLHVDSSLRKCVSEIVNIADFIGDMGEIMIDDFYDAIIDYYNLDHTEIAKKEEEIKQVANEQALKQKK